MLQLQARLLLVQAYEETKDSKLVAQMFKVTRRSVTRLYKQYKETGSLETRTHLRGRKSKITEAHRQKIHEILHEMPDATFDEIRERLHLDCSNSALSRVILHKLGYTRKRKVIVASEQKRPRCKREAAQMDGIRSQLRHGEGRVSG